jgi:hypothetical protein
MDELLVEELEDMDKGVQGEEGAENMEEFKLNHLVRTSSGKPPASKGPVSGLTSPVPRFRQDLEALLQLTQSTKPILQRVRNASCVTMAFYGFGDASSSGFGASIMRPDGLHTRYGI